MARRTSTDYNRERVILCAGAPISGGRVLARLRDDARERGPGPDADAAGALHGARRKVIMLSGAIPGETVEAVIDEERRDYVLASTINVVEPSPERMEPPCPYFGTCGGCHLQYASYAKQVAMKEAVLADNLRRIGKLDVALAPALVLEDGAWGYRYRAQFKVHAPSIGFFKEKSNEVVDIERCPLLMDELNGGLARIRSTLAANPDSFASVSEIHATCGDGLLGLVRLRRDMRAQQRGTRDKPHLDDIAGSFINSGFDGLIVKSGASSAAYGKDHLTLPLNGIDYTVSPGGFIQSNWRLNRVMVAHILSELGALSGKRVLDLYAGAGNFALPLAQAGATIVAVEENINAVADGRRNLERNTCANVRFVCSPLEAFDLSTAGRVDIAIIDPPRSGGDAGALDSLLDARPERIVYVSCDTATLARDLRKLAVAYKIDSTRLVDLFPQTYHLESLTFLSKET